MQELYWCTYLKAYSIDYIHWINNIAKGFTHLAAMGISYHGMEIHLPRENKSFKSLQKLWTTVIYSYCLICQVHIVLS